MQMFDKFGEFNSAEELNMAAEGLLKEGDTKSLKELAEENGIEIEDVEDYIAGDTDQLATLSMAAYGRLNVLENQEIASLKNQIEKMPLAVIMQMLKGMATEQDMQKAIMTKGKRLTSIYAAMRDAAEKHKSGSIGVACGTDRELCNIIKAYYTESDKDFKKKISNLYR